MAPPTQATLRPTPLKIGKHEGKTRTAAVAASSNTFVSGLETAFAASWERVGTNVTATLLLTGLSFLLETSYAVGPPSHSFYFLSPHALAALPFLINDFRVLRRVSIEPGETGPQWVAKVIVLWLVHLVVVAGEAWLLTWAVNVALSLCMGGAATVFSIFFTGSSAAAAAPFRGSLLARLQEFFAAVLASAQPSPTGLYFLPIFAPSAIIHAHKNRDEPYNALQALAMHHWFDVPMVVAGYICRELLGVRLFCHFATILDADIVQGSMPFPSDAATLAAPPFNVVAVVNMCREWPGPQTAYERVGITQLRLPHQDTLAPKYAALMRGCAFIRQQLDLNPGKRVYVHCKGGIARASTMTLSHYIVNRKCTNAEAKIEEMKAMRPMVMRSVTKYGAIRRLMAERAGKY